MLALEVLSEDLNMKTKKRKKKNAEKHEKNKSENEKNENLKTTKMVIKMKSFCFFVNSTRSRSARDGQLSLI